MQVAGLKFANGRLIVELPYEDKIRLEIYDVVGRVAKGFNGRFCSGVHEFELSEKRGIYFAILRYTGGNERLKFVRL